MPYLYSGFLCVCCVIIATQAADVTITTPLGKIRGIEQNNIRQFLGVRYAMPPTAERRFKAPVGYTWEKNSVYDATTIGDVCIQGPDYPAGFNSFNMSEDCLFLNIFTPANVTTELLPVKFWIHGGGYLNGAGSQYPGDQLAEMTNSVVVTINYRLGIFGFLWWPGLTPDDGANFGLMDQQYALKWVADNIKAFGGDPSNVLIFGESAGGGSISHHLVMKESFQYYHKALMESAGPWISFTCSKIYDYVYKPRYIQPLCPQGNSAECLRSVPYEALLSVAVGLPLLPCVDGNLLNGQPLDLIKDGQFNNVPIMLGHNSQEGYLLGVDTLHSTPGVSDPYTINQTTYDHDINLFFGFMNTTELNNWYENDIIDKGLWEAFCAIQGDYSVTCGVKKMGDYLVKNNNTPFFYVFSHPPKDWRWSRLGATHSAEIAYVFSKDGIFQNKFSSEMEIQLSEHMISYIHNFHLNGKPNVEPLPSWPSFNEGEFVLQWDINIQQFGDAAIWDKCEDWANIFGVLF